MQTAVKHDPSPASGEDTTPQRWLKQLGPGLITGAADDDPSGIATYSQSGAQFGHQLLWTVLLTYPLMVSIQAISARIGRVSGHGLATNIRQHYPAWLLYAVVGSLLIANTINIAADVAAMGEATALLIPGPSHWYAAAAGLISVVLQVCIPYQRYVRVLKWLTLALLAYVVSALSLSLPWTKIIGAMLWPHLSLDTQYITTVVAVFGTTISPYLFFWQASQEVEELRADPAAKPLKRAIAQARSQLGRITADTRIGMAFSNLVAMFIMVASAATAGTHGVTQIQSAAQAASALRPVAGECAFAIFAAGIVGTGLLAVPVLAGSAAYAMAGAFGWKNSLELSYGEARKFYLIIIAATILGTLLCFTRIDPMQALYWSAVVNGVVAVPVMVVLMHLASNSAVMGKLRISRSLAFWGWLCTAAMAVAVAAMFWTMYVGATHPS